MRRLVGVLASGLIAGLISVAQANAISPSVEGQTRPLQPLGHWEMIPSDTRCTIVRAYGDSAKPAFLDIHESISAKSFELIVTGAARMTPIVRELPGRIKVGGDQINRWGLHFVNDKGTDFDKFGLTFPEMSKVAGTDVISFQVDGEPNQSFALTGLADALRQLDQCTARLQHEWRVDEPDAPAGIRGVRDDVRTPFATWAHVQMRSGTVQFVVLVDETGKIAGCDVQVASGAPLLEELGCELIRSESKAVPAHDQTGKTVKDSFRTPPIIVR